MLCVYQTRRERHFSTADAIYAIISSEVEFESFRKEVFSESGALRKINKVVVEAEGVGWVKVMPLMKVLSRLRFQNLRKINMAMEYFDFWKLKTLSYGKELDEFWLNYADRYRTARLGSELPMNCIIPLFTISSNCAKISIPAENHGPLCLLLHRAFGNAGMPNTAFHYKLSGKMFETLFSKSSESETIRERFLDFARREAQSREYLSIF